MIKKTIIYNLIFLSLPFIYYPIIPNGPESQPFVPLLLLILSIDFKSKKIRLEKSDFFLLIGFVLLTFHFLFISSVNKASLLAFISYLIGPFFLIFGGGKILLNVNPKIPEWMIKFYFISGILSMTPIGLVSKILYFLHSPLPRYSINSWNSIRGFSFYTPEPSYIIFSFTLLYITANILYSKGKIERKKYIGLTVMLFLCALISKSLLVIGILSSILILNSFSLKRTFWLFPLFICTILLYINLFESSRLAQIIGKISSQNLNDISFSVLIAFDSSFASRIIANYSAFRSLDVTLLGVGIGNAQNELFNIISQMENSWVLRDLDVFRYNSSYKPQTYLSNLVLEIGVFSIPFIVFIIQSIFHISRQKMFHLALFILLTLVAIQGQISNPIIWLILAYAIKKEKIEEEKNTFSSN